jgi:hypothetical protein
MIRKLLVLTAMLVIVGFASFLSAQEEGAPSDQGSVVKKEETAIQKELSLHADDCRPRAYRISCALYVRNSNHAVPQDLIYLKRSND